MISKIFNQIKKNPFLVNYLLTESIVILSVLQMFLSATIPSLKIFQIPVELALLWLLLYACTTIKYDRWQLLLVWTFVFVTALSFTTNSLPIIMVNLKQNGLAILALMYFSKAGYKSKLILPICILTLSLVIVNMIVPGALDPFIDKALMYDFNQSRFGGFFLNTHYNALFLSTALIYYGHKRNLYFIGLPVIYLTYSKYVLAAYFLSLIVKFKFINKLAKSRMILFILFILFIYFIYLLKDAVPDVVNYLETRPFGLNLRSASIILLQLFDASYYSIYLNPLPGELLGHPSNSVSQYSALGHTGHIEIGYLYLASTFGIFLGSLYLYIFLKHALYFRTFVLIVLLHSYLIFTPLLIYMILVYSRDIKHNQLIKL